MLDEPERDEGLIPDKRQLAFIPEHDDERRPPEMSLAKYRLMDWERRYAN